MNKDKIKQALEFDPLAAAEKMTGESYHDGPTGALGMLLQMEHSRKKESLLKAAQDSHYNITFVEFIALAEAEGFRIVLDEEFTGEGWGSNHPSRPERFVIMWHDDGFLMRAESYNTTRLNSANFYFNALHDGTSVGAAIMGLGSSSPIIQGDPRTGEYLGRACGIDAREGFRYRMNELRSMEGITIPKKWVQRPWLWLLTYMDTRVDGYDYAAINEARIAKLPKEVQEAIGPKGD